MKLVEAEGQKLKVCLNIIVLALSLYGVSSRNLTYKESSSFENLMVETFAPMQRSITYLRNQVSSFFENYVANVSASKENFILVKKIGELEENIFSFEQMTKENIRLKQLLAFGEEIQRKKVLAQVVAKDASSDYQVLRINKGMKEGLTLQSTVVTSEGLVGYVYRLTDHFADVLTIIDSNNRVDGMVERIRSHGIIEGDSDDRAIMKYVARTEPIILNDLVLTSGFGNIYPKGIRIGKVSRIERESYGITQSIEINPSVNFSRLEEVVVLVASDNSARKLEWQALDQPVKEGKK